MFRHARDAGIVSAIHWFGFRDGCGTKGAPASHSTRAELSDRDLRTVKALHELPGGEWCSMTVARRGGRQPPPQ